MIAYNYAFEGSSQLIELRYEFLRPRGSNSDAPRMSRNLGQNILYAGCSFEICTKFFYPEDRRNRDPAQIFTRGSRGRVLPRLHSYPGCLPEHERHAYMLAHCLNFSGFDQSPSVSLFTPRPHFIGSWTSV